MELVNFLDVAPKYKAFFLDSYGVLKNAEGLIPGIEKTIAYFKKEGLPFFILTNDASRSPNSLIKSFEKKGLQGLSVENIVSSGMMTRAYLKEKAKGGKIAFLGPKHAAQYIEEIGLETIPVAEVKKENYDSIEALAFLDDEGFDWQSAINTTINLIRKTNIPVLVANSDLTYPSSNQEVALATGALAQIVARVTGTECLHFGKPDGQMFWYAFGKLQESHPHISKKEILMVGDTLRTDILGGNKFGVDTMLTLSGNTSKRRAFNLIKAKGIQPDYVVESIGI